MAAFTKVHFVNVTRKKFDDKKNYHRQPVEAVVDGSSGEGPLILFLVGDVGEGDQGAGHAGPNVGPHHHGNGDLDGDDAGGHHGHDDSGASGGTLHQHGEKHPNHQTHNRIG